MLDLGRLDEDQLKAVTAPDGVVRVMAGAGTGKTTTLQSRVAFILEKDLAEPHQVMTVTFTNKAASEIRERVTQSVGDRAKQIRMGTFHSLSLRILRKYAEGTGLKSGGFTILDDEEVKQLFDEAVDRSGVVGTFQPPTPTEDMSKEQLKALVKIEKNEFDANRKLFMKEVLREIPRWKENGLHVSQALELKDPSAMQADLIAVYDEYQRLLDEKNMCDFADLILRVVHLFDQNPELAAAASREIKYVLVDEFQDVNMLQFRWLRHLTQHHGNLFVVGDLDQSLYSFRGSAPQIMERLSDMTTCDVVLKQNRRCTAEILAPANMLVDINPRPNPKVLKSEKLGNPVQVSSAPNEFAEANMVVTAIRKLLDAGSEPDEIAILGRAGYVVKPLEKSLIKAGIPYALLGGNSILDKEEVKDVLAYLKLAVDPFNDIAFSRIANKPARGCGPTTVSSIIEIARVNSVPFHDACQLVASEAVKSAARKNVLKDISQLGGTLSALAIANEMGTPPAALVDMALVDSGYVNYLKTKEDSDIRRRNVEFIKSFADQFEELVDCIQEFSIVTEAVDEGNGVRIATIHASKGLEFDHIFLPAWDEGVFPSMRAIDEIPGDIDDPWVGPPIGGVEEERRIAHVALTRAKVSATIMTCYKRAGRRSAPSRFLEEAELTARRPDEDFYQGGGPDTSDFSGIKPKRSPVMARKRTNVRLPNFRT